MYDWVETYGYPKDTFIGSKQYRFSIGWFFVGLDADEPACYMDFYFIDEYNAILVLDYWHSHEEIDLLENLNQRNESGITK